jgi:hypothetical protein
VDNRWARLVVLLLADPHRLEGRQGGKDRTTDPDGVLALGRGDDLDLHRRWGHRCDFLLHTVSNTREHGRTAGHDGVGVQILTDINVALHDRVEGRLVDTARFHTDEGWLEQRLRATETLVADGDDLQVQQSHLYTYVSISHFHLLNSTFAIRAFHKL